MVFTYQPEDESKFKYAFILIDHATKAVYKVDINKNDAMANATAFTEIAKGTHMYSLNYPKTLEVQTGTATEGIAHLSTAALMLKLRVNRPKEEDNCKPLSLTKQGIHHLILASRAINGFLRGVTGAMTKENPNR